MEGHGDDWGLEHTCEEVLRTLALFRVEEGHLRGGVYARFH